MFGRSSVGRTTPLNFPNSSRSFDPTRDRVRFWGYDRSLEVSFFVEASALRRLVPGVERRETDILRAFDQLVEQIHEAARAEYARRRQDAYVLTLENV
jgi:hypothetical protein